MYNDRQRPFLADFSPDVANFQRRMLPVVVGAIFANHDNDRDLRVVLDRVHSVGCIGEMLFDIGTQALEGRFAESTLASTVSFGPVCTYARSACAPSTAWLCTALAFCVLWLKAKLDELSTSKYRPSPIELWELTMTCWLEPGSLTVMNCSSLYFSNAGVNSDIRLGLEIVNALISATPGN